MFYKVRILTCKISKYLDFKISEVWSEISSELYFENIRPVTPDLECISVVEIESEIKAKIIQTKQFECIHKKNQVCLIYPWLIILRRKQRLKLNFLLTFKKIGFGKKQTALKLK